MKIINFGSLNIDKVYSVENFADPGQTIFAKNYAVNPGGKGLNQSVACARAGAKVIHAGIIGNDGLFLKELLKSAGVSTKHLLISDEPSGHAIIEVESTGQNRIIVFGGTNQLLTEEYIDSVLEDAAEGDIALLQNETNLTGEIIKKAHEKGMKTAFNPSPVPETLADLPLELVDFFMVNEIEGACISGAPEDAPFEEILDLFSKKFPDAAVIMTLGGKGSLYKYGDEIIHQDIFRVPVKDTTAAGDTFSGYFLSALCRGENAACALKEASAASAITVSRPGAAPSIPEYDEVKEMLMKF